MICLMIFLGIAFLFLYSACKVSSECSRLEEKMNIKKCK